MAEINLPFGAISDRRAPASVELQDGFLCGPADIELFNWLHWWTTGEISEVIIRSSYTPSSDVLGRLAEAVRSQRMNFVVAGGTGDAITVDLLPAPVSLPDLTGMPLNVVVSAANAGPATLAVGDLPAQPILRADNGAPLIGADWSGAAVLSLVNDGDAWRLVSPQARTRVPLLFFGCL